MPLVLSGIVVLHLKQNLIHLGKIGAVLLVNLLNDDRQRITLLFPASSFAGDRPEAFRSALQLDSALEVLFQAVILQQHLVVHIDLIPPTLGQHGIEEFCVYAELVDLLIKQAADLRDEGIDAVKTGQSGLEEILFFLLQCLKAIQRRTDGSLKFTQIAAGLLLGGIENLRKPVNFHLLIYPVLVQGVLQVVHHIGVGLFLQNSLLIVGLKGFSDILGGVNEVQDKGILFAPHGAVQPGKGLDSLHAGQLLVHKHGVQQWLIEAGLIFFRHDQHPIFVCMERFRQGLLLDGLAGFCFIQLLLSVGFPIVLHLAGEGHQHIQVSVALLLDLPLELQQVAHCMEPRGRYDHCFGLAANFVPGYIAELLQHDSRFLRDVVGVQHLKLANSTHTGSGVQFRVVGDGLGNLVVHVIGHVVLQYIQNKAFLNGLPHGVHVEGMVFTIFIPLAEHLKRFVLWGGRKGEEGKVFMNPLGGQFIQQLVLIVLALGFFLVLLFGVLL